ncbi:GNAT family N-acetyltransferase [Hyalangium rubrum]|uniref:GNAT family N-acetyltransferase n=1 Tax=Hyalangium rubrum TaxID=3103134 RepID=A0ABU5HI22_9BACT|nr:GNAT family N-acetyltransferase [Hyalangium sp. s54d21]MDY7231730.1 GNAT family N-acetyltransferase [Hyalangium sp. s54d21]
MSPPPVILATPRIELTEMLPPDAEAVFELNSDPEVIRYTGDGPFASVEAARDFLTAYPDYRTYGYGRWAMRRKSDGAMLGWCGLKYLRDTQETDLGYRLYRRHWGQGYATEAGLACLAYGFDTLGLSRIVARVVEANVASVRVLEKCGLRRIGSIDFDGEPGLLFAVERPLP